MQAPASRCVPTAPQSSLRETFSVVGNRATVSGMSSAIRTGARILLGVLLAGAGVSHLTWARDDFAAQVPAWVPFSVDFVVVSSGVVEIVLGLALLFVVRNRALVGLAVAVFFVAVFPGNISQYATGTDAFGLDTDAKRFVRLFFQPVLVVWALWCTGLLPFRRDLLRSR
jgi:uncharacterized membrane protein